jgi:hypothetical protein
VRRRAVVVALLLTAAIPLAGCREEAAGPGVRAPDPAEVQQQEDIVNDLERVVGSAEAETAND